MFLKCNNLKCRINLKFKYYISSCEHIFCEKCATEIAKYKQCLKCKKKIINTIKCKKYKNIDLRGYSISYIHDITKLATNFFLTQIMEEMRLINNNRTQLYIERNKLYSFLTKKFKPKDIGKLLMNEEKAVSTVDPSKPTNNSEETSSKDNSSTKHQSNVNTNVFINKKIQNKIISSSESEILVQNVSNKKNKSTAINIRKPQPSKSKNNSAISSYRNENSSNNSNLSKIAKFKLLPEDIKERRKLILANLIKSNHAENTLNPSEDELPKYNKFIDNN